MLMVGKTMGKNEKYKSLYYSDQSSTQPNFLGSAWALLRLPSQGHSQSPDDLLMQS